MIKRNLVLIGAAIAVLVSTGCAIAQATSEDELGLRKTPLYQEDKTVADLSNYSTVVAGESTPIARSFENAPPMISHSVEGMLPITTSYNSCLDCHMPEVASALNTLPAPASHFATFRPITEYVGGEFRQEGKAVSNTSDIKTIVHERQTLSMERYVCSSCHAPQSTNAQLVENTFTPDFRSEAGGIASSNLLDNLNEGVR